MPRTIESSIEDDALAGDQGAIGIVLELDAQVADLVAGLDEGAARHNASG